MSADDPNKAKVGYGRPPVHSRFKPGQSGNPRGRKKGTLNFATDLKRTLERQITLTDPGKKPRKVTTQAAALLRLCEKALKGDARSLDRFIELARMLHTGPTPEPTTVASSDDQAILEAYREQVRLEQSAKDTAALSTDSKDDAK
jgi:uncharacterized protein DUF5681